MIEVIDKIIMSPTASGDGISCCDSSYWLIKNCVVDFENINLSQQDELLGVTWNSSAIVMDSTFINGKKAILCGSGDSCEDRSQMRIVDIKKSTISNFGRRGPEVQDGYIVTLENCTIKNWGMKDVFDVRCFAGWAHHGGKLIFKNCRFEQQSFFQTGLINFFKDLVNHIGQAWNYSGWKCLFNWRTYLPGVMRGAIATNGGEVYCINCTKNKWWIVLEGL